MKLLIVLVLLLLLLILIKLYLSREHFITIRILKHLKTHKETAQGLMFVKNPLPKNSGYLFENPSKFWMKNTYIPLDIIFINKHKDKNHYKIIGYLENMVPKSLESRGIQKKSNYAIEVNAGTIKNLKLKVGDVIKLD
jgi:uncharacterized protein